MSSYHLPQDYSSAASYYDQQQQQQQQQRQSQYPSPSPPPTINSPSPTPNIQQTAPAGYHQQQQSFYGGQEQQHQQQQPQYGHLSSSSSSFHQPQQHPSYGQPQPQPQLQQPQQSFYGQPQQSFYGQPQQQQYQPQTHSQPVQYQQQHQVQQYSGPNTVEGFVNKYGKYHKESMARAGQAPTSKFETANGNVLCCHLYSEHIWIKLGSMIAYTGGKVTFSRETIRDQGLLRTIKEGITKEGMELVKATAKGAADLFLADEGKRVLHMMLQPGEAVIVNGVDVLAFESSVKWDIVRNKSIGSLAQGGLFNVKLTGPGWICVTTHFEPLVLHVRNGHPVFTDPDNTVMWSSSCRVSFKTDIKFKSLFGSQFKSGEEYQMKFEGQGFVVIQPLQELKGGT